MKLTYIGAGSAVFARQVMTDVLSVDGLDQGTLALIDINAERLDLARQIGEMLVKRSGKDWEVVATTERKEVLPGSDYVINSIEVAGLSNVKYDYEIPLKYGVDQCIGDTVGPGGIFKALRTGPVWLDIVRDVQQLAPRAVLINYTNPMAIITLLALRASQLSVVGLCHSVQSSSRHLASYLDIPYEELTWDCAGINHNSWFTRLERDGEDMYPLLRERVAIPEVYERDPVRFEVMLNLGAFVTESSGHFSEYCAYFRKRPDLIEKYTRPDWLGGSGFYAKNWPTWHHDNEEWIRKIVAGEQELPAERSLEYASRIIEAIELDRPTVIYGNVRNAGLIDNLLPDGCVEVATLVDSRGLRPTHVGRLPEQLAAHNRTHMAMHELVVKAISERDRQSALYALMIDPLTAAVCSLDEIRKMFDEMWEAQRPSLAAYE